MVRAKSSPVWLFAMFCAGMGFTATYLGAEVTAPISVERQFEPETRIFRSASDPRMAVRIAPGYRYLGRLEFPLGETAWVDRHYWVETDADRVERLVVFQFEQLLPSAEGRYRFVIPEPANQGGSDYRYSPAPVELGGHEYVHNTWAFDLEASARSGPGKESDRTLRLFEQLGLRCEPELVMSRYVRAVGDDARKEVILFYMEPLSATGNSLAGLASEDPASGVYDRLSARVTERSREAFEVIDWEPVTREGLEAINGTELWVKRTGSGEPIVVVHGGPVMEHGYLVSHLAPLAEDHELIFFDQRLSGRSAPEVEADSVRLATFAEDIEALRTRLELGPIHLMGHSWGGLLAMEYALRYPKQLRSLILLDSMAASSALWQQEQQALGALVTPEDAAARRVIMASEAFAERRPSAVEALLRLSFKPQFVDPDKLERLELYVPEDYAARSAQFAGLGPELQSFDFHEGLRSLEMPALVLYGDGEPGAELGGQAIHNALPNSKYVVIEDAGHFPFLEQPEAFLRAVREFLARIP